MGILTLAMVLEEISKVCASTALLLIAQTDGMLPIIHGGSPELKERFLRRFEGESTLLTALGATEPNAGSDLLAMKTRAVRKGDKYVINGQKCFITNGSVADVIVVYAYTDPEKGAKGISAFVVEKGTPGLVYGRNESKMGMRGSINSELFFENMEIPAENLIGAEGTGFANLMQTLSTNRVFCAAQAVADCVPWRQNPLACTSGPFSPLPVLRSRRTCAKGGSCSVLTAAMRMSTFSVTESGMN